MSANSNKFGHLFQWATFGESHGSAMGVIIDGCPAGLAYDEALLLEKLGSRRPGNSQGTSDRKELDQPEILSGIFENKTLGTPIAVIVRNTSQRSQDYDAIKETPRVGHADDVWKNKFSHSDHRGGGRASARETVNWVIAGAFAQMYCQSQNSKIKVQASLTQVGSKKVSGVKDIELLEMLEQAKVEGESFGALIELKVENPPAFIGEPVFKKIKSELSSAFMTINACCGVELGDGFALAQKKGTEVHSNMESEVYGGSRGGITTGENLKFNLAFKPTSSILDVAKLGRHDPCVAMRALPIVEAMTWNVLADLLLAQKLNQL